MFFSTEKVEEKNSFFSLLHLITKKHRCLPFDPVPIIDIPGYGKREKDSFFFSSKRFCHGSRRENQNSGGKNSHFF